MKFLSELTPPELIILQKHIELGTNHLIHFLGKKGFHDLLALTKLDKESVEKLTTDDTETTGNLVLAVNTILTGCFGGWMGLYGMLELDLGSPSTFYTILSLATLVGAGIGYLSFLQTKNTAISAIERLKLLQLEDLILGEIHAKRSQEVREIEDQIQSTVIKAYPDSDSSTLVEWSKKLDQVLEDKLSLHQKSPLFPFLQRETALFRTTMQQHLESLCEQKKPLEVVHPSPEERKKNLSLVLQKLIYDSPRTPAQTFQSPIPVGNLILSLIPTLFGGFGSLFVYLSGSTNIARAFEQNQLVAFLMSPEAQFVKIILAISITIYFGLSLFYSKKKSHQRTKEIEKKEQILIQKEAILTILDEKLFKLRKIKADVEKIIEIFQFA